MRRRLLVALIVLVPLAWLLPGAETRAIQTATTPVAVLTQHNDTSRSGLNLDETILTTSNVNPAQFGKLFTLPVDGQIYAQPLYVPHVYIPNQGYHNVVYVATMHDSVYAFDADSPGPPLWQVSLGTSIPVPDPCFGYRYGPYHDIQIEVGIVSTPAINLRSHAIYVLAATKDAPSGGQCNPAAYVHRLHALDITTGRELFGGPVVITATAPGSGPDSVNGVIAFNSMQELQRPALLLSHGVVYVAFGSYADTDPYHGWILGYAAGTLKHVLTYLDTPTPDPSRTYYEAGIWQSGQGPTADITGNLYVNIGNGWWNAGFGGRDYGDSIVKVTAALTVSDWFTPYNQSYLNTSDLDLGSSGVLLIPGTNLLLGGGKQGVLYLLDSNHMGHFHPGGDTQIVQSFPASIGEIMGAPVCWNGPGGELCYLWGAGDTLKAFSFANGAFNITLDGQGYAIPASQSSMPASWPGGFLSVSANGNVPGTGIVWATAPTYNPSAGAPSTRGPIHNRQGGATPGDTSIAGTLYAFDASNLGTELWDSQMNSADNLGALAKFNIPTVANGKVYAPTFSNALVVYGLLPAPRPTSTPTPTPAPLPTPWQHGDIGNVGVPGSAGYANGVFTVSGSGSDIWGTADAFHYVYQPWTGDGQIVARVTSQTATDPWAKAGVMVRETLDPSSTYADLVMTPGNGAAFQRRLAGGGDCISTSGPLVQTPYWVKLARQGSTFSGYVSPDGVGWTLVATDTIAMTTSVYVGLPVTAHNNALLSTATFDNVSVGAVTAPAIAAPAATATPSARPGGAAPSLSPATGAGRRR